MVLTGSAVTTSGRFRELTERMMKNRTHATMRKEIVALMKVPMFRVRALSARDHRLDDRGEGRPDDDTDPHVHGVALDRKFLEFLDDLHASIAASLMPDVEPISAGTSGKSRWSAGQG